MNKLAPIIVFVYNRPHHTKQTLEALKKNTIASQSELYIFSDGAANNDLKAKINEVRNYVKDIRGFKKTTLIERRQNLGLANSIIDGVTRIINKHGKVIVLEDDIVTSPYFLKFMNDALNFYEKKKDVWHISGWNYPIDNKGLNDVFFWRLMNCWGWATWSDRWVNFEKNVEKTIKNFSKDDIKKFNIDGASDFWSQVINNKEGNINTWAIFWYAIIFKNNGLCLNPSKTFLENIGHDGSGINCRVNSTLSSDLSKNNNINFDIDVKENAHAVEKIKRFYMSQKKPLLIRAINKISRIIFRKDVFKNLNNIHV